MNQFEILNFKKQAKFTQVIFEDIPMLILDTLVIVGILSVPKVSVKLLSESTVYM